MATEARLGKTEKPPSSRTGVGVSRLLQHGVGHSAGTCRGRARLGGEAPAFTLAGSIASKPTRGRPRLILRRINLS